MYGFKYNSIIFLIKLYNHIMKFLSIFIANKDKRKKFRMKTFIQKKGYSVSPAVKRPPSGIGAGKNYPVRIYYPIYSQVPVNKEHNIYNKEGQPMHTFFMRSHISYRDTQSKYFIWDKYNYTLDVHFYLHDCVIEQTGNPKKRYAMFHEPYSCVPEGYEVFEKNKGIEKDFDLIFTHYGKFLEKYDNARFFNPFARIWFALKDENGNLPENWQEYKTKNVSLVSSPANFSELHRLRKALAFECKEKHLLDTFGTFDGGPYIQAHEALTNYKYSIAIENEIDDYWFTEKILNCFSHMVIPIYVGARKINTLFNPDGIIQVTPEELKDIEKVLKQCTTENWLSRAEAMKENYYKSLKYQHTLDTLYEKYLEPELKQANIGYNFIDV